VNLVSTDLNTKFDLAVGFFQDVPSIAKLNSPPAAIHGAPIKVRVWQNHSPALFLRFSNSFARFSGYEIQFLDEGYDDSFSWFGLQNFESSASSHVIWVDIDRFTGDEQESQSWFLERLRVLRSNSAKTIVCYLSSMSQLKARLWRDAIEIELPGVGARSTWESHNRSVDGVIDARMERIGGTYVSARAQSIAARNFAVQDLVSSVVDPVKLIIVDLDWTLYSGVLLEDGPEGITLTDEHLALWGSLREAHDSGILLGIASKNEPTLVSEFFSIHVKKLPLGLDDFVGTEIHFGNKSESVASLIDVARTVPSASVFIDDNVGELAEVITKVPDLNLIVGGLGETTHNWLRGGIAGINWGARDANAKARLADIKARILREGLNTQERAHEVVDSTAFLKDMGISITVRADNPADLERLTDMIARTNQFNTNLERKSLADVQSVATINDTHWVTVSLRDKFAESGIIFSILAEKDAESSWFASNFVLSCRAMGRGLEPLIVRESLKALADVAGAESISVPWIEGPRNQPALDFLRAHSAKPVEGSSGVAQLSASSFVIHNNFENFVSVSFEKGTKK